MIWTCISINGRTNMIIIWYGTLTAQQNETLGPIVVLYSAKPGEEFIYKANNAKQNWVQLVNSFLFNEEILRRLDWPTYSPNMVPKNMLRIFQGVGLLVAYHTPETIRQF
ncbi:hypothetical protein TNCV_34541 [Trichonephila clavipes]|nr:hypothetical protein TNCV_34541 [Trichonephila clavipes]